ncbi:MAG: hypothetical protein Q8N63_04385 [Nanoarchaeota archaeon]|nr:hypothetical protein [Nanoarchaeota archaeon]
MDCLELKTREPTEEEINEMEFWMRTGCVHDYYLKNALGDISIGIGPLLYGGNMANKLFESLIKNPDDYDKLPHDCQARAAQRLRKFFNKDIKVINDYAPKDYARDIEIVFGSTVNGIDISEKSLRRHFGFDIIF